MKSWNLSICNAVLLDVDLRRPTTVRTLLSGGRMAHVMLERQRHGEQQLALRLEQMDLGLRRHELADGGAEELSRVTENARRAHPALLVAGQLAALPNMTCSVPSSSRAPRVTLPLSTRGSEISRLYGPTVTKSSPSRWLKAMSFLSTNGRWRLSS